MASLHELGRAVVPLVIAVDPAMVVVVFLALTEGSTPIERRRVMRQALVTAFVVGGAFLVLGHLIFRLLGIDRADFEIGGGLILLVLSLADLVMGDRSVRRIDEFVGVVPIGTPLIVGPAVLTAISVEATLYGHAVTAAALLSTFVVVAAALALSGAVARLIGVGGLKAVSKIISILLAGFAAHLIRSGILEIVGR